MDSSAFVFPASSAKPVTIPSIQYLKFGDTEEELFNSIRVQVDFWINGMVKADQVAERIYLLTHGDVGQEIGGERMWAQYLDSQIIDYPAKSGVVHEIMEFEFKPSRALYVA